MKIACCVWAMQMPEIDMLRSVKDLGFDWIDIQPKHLETPESQLLAQELGLRVSCVGASFGMPEGAALDHIDAHARRTAIDHVARAIGKAVAVGADTAYVVPGTHRSPDALERFADSMTQLAEAAGERDLKLAIEHFPGTALPTAAETLAFIHETNHSNLFLLYDSGHIQISGEDPATVILNAADQLAYVHFDDNDGISDLHLSLLDGVMTEDSLAKTIGALDLIGYRGAVSLELNPGLPKPSKALSESLDVLLRTLHYHWR